jgi:hypothetical protein
MITILATALVFPLLGGVPTEAATAAATIGPLGIPEDHAPPINQKEDRAIVKVAEWCGADSFKDEYGKCRPYGYDAPPPNPHDACPPNRHFVHWVYHTGGRCVPNY